MDAFLADLEKCLGIKQIRLSLSEQWQRNGPQQAEGQALEACLKSVIVDTYFRDFSHSMDDFRRRYPKRHHKSPYANSFVRWRWNLGKHVIDADYAEGMKRLELHKTSFLKEIMRPTEQFTLLVLPIANVEPTYRDITPSPTSPPTGFDQLFVSPILGAPDMVVPIGKMQYLSRITEVEEMLPIAVNLVSPPGTDSALIDVILRCLRQAKRPTSVSTGCKLFL